MDVIAVFGSIVFAFGVLLNFAVHKIEEGHMGVYYRVRILSCNFILTLMFMTLHV